GIHFWLRLYSPYRRALPILIAFAILIPVAALAGFVVAGSSVASAIEVPRVFENLKNVTHWPGPTASGTLAWLRTLTRIEFGGLLAVIALYLLLGYLTRRFGPKVTISYTGGPTIKMPPGPTLLEMSRMGKVPHASVCGGRARCSTCRVRIDKGGSSLPAPVFPESVTLGSINAPPNVRLACQIRPTTDLIVTRLLKAG